ncbi:hypothetical protein Q0F98_00805 [Paenibacillus amylolyticus]|nr:hypothetical protein Q0F98_00805 [Paenibacillus amylolyticus]
MKCSRCQHEVKPGQKFCLDWWKQSARRRTGIVMVKRSNLLILDVVYLICMLVSSIVSFTVFNHALLSFSFG